MAYLQVFKAKENFRMVKMEGLEMRVSKNDYVDVSHMLTTFNASEMAEGKKKELSAMNRNLNRPEFEKGASADFKMLYDDKKLNLNDLAECIMKANNDEEKEASERQDASRASCRESGHLDQLTTLPPLDSISTKAKLNYMVRILKTPGKGRGANKILVQTFIHLKTAILITLDSKNEFLF